jgi:hypothetical protein
MFNQTPNSVVISPYEVSANSFLNYVMEKVKGSSSLSNRLCTYDGIKLRVHSEEYVQFILSDGIMQKFKFKSNKDEHLGRVLSYIGEYKNFQIKVHYTPKGMVTDISGSIHKWSNEGKHNYNQFTYSSFLFALKEICDVFYINIENTHVVNLEVGVNIVLPERMKLSVSDIIEQVLSIAGKGRATRRIEEKQRESFFTKKGERYYKMYDKGLQNGLEERILRMELGYTTSRQLLKDAQISVLSDLVHIDILDKFNNLLIKCFSTLHTTQPEMLDLPIEITQSNRIVSKFQSRKFWFDLKKRDRKSYSKYRKLQEQLHHEYNGYSLREELLKLLKDKF